MTEFPTKLRPPLAMLAELTHRCPLQCPYCSNPIALSRRSEELPTEKWEDVIGQAGDMGVLQIHLSGGEPTLRKDLPSIVAAARRHNIYTNLITAGVFRSRRILSDLVDSGLDHVQLSIQSNDAPSAEMIGNLKGAHAHKLQTASWVREHGLPLTINVVVHRQNLDYLQEIIKLSYELGAHRLEIANVQYYGWALKNRASLMPTEKQVRDSTAIVHRAIEYYKGSMAIDFVVPDYYARRPKRCMDGWGSQFFAVTPRGLVLPCHAAESITGLDFSSVRDHSLKWIWQYDEAFNRFRGVDWMSEPCRSCEYRDRDLGGCRCQAFALTGDAAAADPVCQWSPHHAELTATAGSESKSDVENYSYRGFSA